MTDTPLPSTNPRTDSAPIPLNSVALVFIESPEGLSVRAYDNLDEDKQTMLIPLTHGILALIQADGGLGYLITQGVRQLEANKKPDTVN